MTQDPLKAFDQWKMFCDVCKGDRRGRIVAIVKEGEAGRKVADVCRSHGITDHTYYDGKPNSAGSS